MTASMRVKRILKELERFDETVGNVLDDELQGHLEGARESLEVVAADLATVGL